MWAVAALEFRVIASSAPWAVAPRIPGDRKGGAVRRARRVGRIEFSADTARSAQVLSVCRVILSA
ncbi:hypothetical protein [Mycobacterium mantenii]|uniref:Uncharacterized protein n=1 Tax=Mycobacterium mantenii TaxID=560555 RepID=A0A1A2T989_MYCNT|nr:hypothetical protein [Mycobacterium mantenii]OBH43090.1 hypothetical protein A5688_14540 [Mycobacterium mantenii]OBH72955.1 hypothetical protein A5683_25435 [Mycobacterium mantenii]